MREELETREQWEFSGREDDLKDLRTVMSEPRKSMSLGATFSYLMLGAVVGVAGLAGYYGLEAMLPDVPTQVAQRPDPATKPKGQDEGQGASVGAGQAGEIEIAAAGPEIVEPVAPIDRAPEPATPGGLPGSGAAERGAPSVATATATALGEVIAGQGAEPELAELGASSDPLARLSGSNSDTEVKDIAEVAALAQEPSSVTAAAEARAPENAVSDTAAQPNSPSVSTASAISVAEGVAPDLPQGNLIASNAPQVGASSTQPSFDGRSIEPNLPGASQSLPGGQPSAQQELAALGSTLQPATPQAPSASSSIARPNTLQTGSAPVAPSIAPPPDRAAAAAGAAEVGQPTAPTGFAPIGDVATAPQAPSGPAIGAVASLDPSFAPRGQTPGALDGATSISRQAAPIGFAPVGDVATAPQASNGPEIGAVSSLGPLTSPGQALSAPEAPDLLGGAYSVGAAANPDQAVVVALASPSQAPLEPNAPASLRSAPSVDPELYGSSGISPQPFARESALSGAPATEITVQGVQVAAVNEAAPILSQSAAIAPGALEAAGVLIDPNLDYQAGLQAAAALADGARDIASGPTTPNGGESPAAGVQVAAVTQLGATQTKAPFEEGAVAPGAAFSLINVGLAPSSPSTAPLVEGQPTVVQPELEASGHTPAPQIAALGLGSTATDDLSGGADPSLRYIIGAAPQFALPSTPNFTVDPEAAFAEPLDALLTTPRPNAPRLSAPTAVAALGADAPDSFTSGGVPTEISIVPDENAGRAAARLAVAREHVGSRAVEYVDDRPAWIRNGVPPRPNPQNLPVISIIIDEVGSYDASLDEVALLPPSVTTSVLPSIENVELTSRRLRHSRREVLVHLPIETNGTAALGSRPILKGMSDVQVRETALWHLEQFQGFIGFNSTRGKAESAHDRVMDAIIKPLADSGLIFLDSRTSKNSAAKKAARDAGLMAASTTVIIDEKRHTGGIHRKLDEAVDYAKKHGAAIAIGNAHAVTVQSVKSWMAKRDGVRVVVQPLTYVTQVANGVPETSIIIAGLPPKRRAPQPSLGEVKENLTGAAGDLSEGASQSVKSTLSGIGAYISERLFER